LYVCVPAKRYAHAEEVVIEEAAEPIVEEEV
jgi:hypothetical protein